MLSVLGQTYRNLELIVVDDGSTDGTQELLAGWRDSRLITLRRPQQDGPATARNEGLHKASGELVAFQDSDDEWLTTKLERQVRLLQKSAPAVGLVLCSYFVHENERVRLVHSPELASGRDYESALLWGYPVATPVWLVKRSVLSQAGVFDTALPCLEDWDLCFRLHQVCQFRATAEPLMVKYGHLDSISADPLRHLQGLQSILQRHGGIWRRHPAHEIRLLREIGLLQCEHQSRHSGIATLLGAIRRAPMSAPLYWSLAAALAGRGAVRHAVRSARQRLHGERPTQSSINGDD